MLQYLQQRGRTLTSSELEDWPGAPAGVGLHSMRERAEELGGSLTVGPGGDDGTLVRAWLPIAAAAEETRR